MAVALLEAMRNQDAPPEVLQDENLSLTMPRRLGLSGVVNAQIRRYREAMQARERLIDDELADLVRLVTRRPDSDEVFLAVGEEIADSGSRGARWRRILPRRIRMWRAGRRVERRLRGLFGRDFAALSSRPLAVEVRNPLLVRGDPGGEACHLVTGLLSSILTAETGRDHVVIHERCMARGDALCRWFVANDGGDPRAERDGRSDGGHDGRPEAGDGPGDPDPPREPGDAPATDDAGS